ncbi:MAG: peptidoglycan-binding protein [Clostridia bacterium]|nr:peptidoglycan-binding protein [Clostridia bacterium]
MPVVFTVPESIVVHLGAPDDKGAPNVTVSFPDYIKNVASSEIYPTWPENAIRANIYAQISFALNRIFTEFYRSRGYDFDITNSTQFDQSFVNDRDIFENISRIVDELFNDYVVRSGDLTPLFARYCDGNNSSCPGGLSQWGSVSLAEQGYTPYRILSAYYGDIQIVEDAPVAEITETYPGTPLRIGSTGDDVKRIQISLNHIGKNYPAIPKIAYPDGIFDVETENAVKEFQRIFNLSPDGIVGKATWYKIRFVFSGVRRLSELDSDRLSIGVVNQQFKQNLSEGDRGIGVETLQYFLNFIAEFNNFIPSVQMDGIFGPSTAAAVRAFQQSAGLPQTGVVDEVTWNSIYSSYITKYNSLPEDYRSSGVIPYPGRLLALGVSGDDVRTLQEFLAFISKTYPEIPTVSVTGYFGPETQAAVLAYESTFGLPERGFVNAPVWASIAEEYSTLSQSEEKTFGQYPGYSLSENTI